MTFKETVQTIQAIVTTIAVLVGGIWTYNLFVKERRNYPHLNVEQKVSHIALSDRVRLLGVSIGIANTGTSRALLRKSIVRIQQILPVLPCSAREPCAVDQVNAALKAVERKEDRFSWPLIGERETVSDIPLSIEPGEKGAVDFEFAIPAKVRVVRVYSYFENAKVSTDVSAIGWSTSTFYDFTGTNKERTK